MSEYTLEDFMAQTRAAVARAVETRAPTRPKREAQKGPGWG